MVALPVSSIDVSSVDTGWLCRLTVGEDGGEESEKRDRGSSLELLAE